MESGPLNLVLLGDIMLGRYVDDSFTANPDRKTAAFGDVLPFLQSFSPEDTLIAGNLECAVTNHHKPTPKAFNFKLSPANADVLQKLRLNFVATANNHVLDYGQEGLAETNKVLTRLGIAHAGSGTQPTASHPAVVTTAGGHRVSFLSYSDHYDNWAATSSMPGINFIDPENYDVELLRQQVAAARSAGSDLVVVLIHWGPNWRWQPDDHLRALGRDLLEAGADVVFGTSPHHLQGVELVGDKVIIYSGASFIDDYAGDDHYRNDLSAIFVARFEPNKPPVAGTAGSTDTPLSSSAAAPPAGAASSSGGRVARAAARSEARFVLRELTAYPIAITHHWRNEGGPFKEAGEGNPPYFSQVDLAKSSDWSWVQQKLQQLCGVFGVDVEHHRDSGLTLVSKKLWRAG